MAGASAIVRLDNSRPVAEVHGERASDDLHANVHFYQDGLPFDAAGILLHDHPEVLKDPKKLALVERKMKKASKLVAPGDDAADAPVASGADAEGNDEGDEVSADDVNLVMWLRGEAKYQFFAIRAAIEKRFAVKVQNMKEAVRFLVLDDDTKLIGVDALAPALKTHVAS